MVEDGRCRRDRIATEEHLQARQLRARHQPQRYRLCSGDRAIQARRAFHRVDVGLLERPRQFGGFAISMARVERSDVGGGDIGRLGELAVQPIDQRLPVPVKHPQRQPQRPHVLAAQRILVAKAVRLDRFNRQRRNIESQHLPLGKGAIVQRADRILGLFQVALGEFAGVDNDQAAGLERIEVGLQRRRVHRHQHIGGIASGIDRGRAEVDLERRDAEQRALRGADFGGEIGESGKVIARQRAGQGELPAGKLHPVAAVTGKADHHRIGTVEVCLFRHLRRHRQILSTRAVRLPLVIVLCALVSRHSRSNQVFLCP